MDFSIVRLLLSISVQKGWLFHQVDYSGSFLQGTLNRGVYMTLPKMLDCEDKEKVCKRRKSIYGRREAPRIWHELLSMDLEEMGLKSLESTPCAFRADGVLVLSYVDNFLVMG